jgi:hypothetical protein
MQKYHAYDRNHIPKIISFSFCIHLATNFFQCNIQNKNKNKKQKNICCLVDARFSSFYYFLRTLVFSKFIIVCHYVGDDKTVLLFFLVCFVYNIYDMLV